MVGKPAPEIQAAYWLNSQALALAGLRGKIVVVEFWATWCPPCRASIPHLIEMNHKFAGKGVVFISLTDEDRKTVEPFAKTMKMDYAVGGGSKTSGVYGVTGIPHAFIVDPSGTVAWEGHPMAGLDRALEDQLKKTPPSRMAPRDQATAPAPMDRVAKAIDSDTLDRWSAKFRHWHYWPDHVVPADPKIEGFAGIQGTDVPTVYQLPGDETWWMSFIGFDGKGYQSFVAESKDLVHWKPKGLAMGYGPEGEFDHGGCVVGAYLYESYDLKAPRVLKKHQGKYWTLYGAYPRQGGYELRPGYEGVASSEDGLAWKRAKPEYILSVHEPDRGEWEKDCIYQPWLVEHRGRYYNFYNAANGGVEQIGLATSTDLLNWTRYAGNPVLRNRSGGYDERLCSDGKVFRDGDHWVMFYFGLGRGGAHIMAAFSRDLLHWTAHPEPLYKAGGNPSGLDKQHAHKISLVYNPKNDTFYMFYDAVPGKPGPTGGRGIGLITSRPLPRPAAATPAAVAEKAD
jgi:thiol-disulfide isomerase/thioredoxin